MIQYVYKITTSTEGDTMSFLKSFDSLIEVNGKLINKENPTAHIQGVNTIDTVSYITSNKEDGFEAMRKWWKEITREKKLSLEYVKDGWVWLLPFKQLHSGLDKPYNQRIIHKGALSTRTVKCADTPDLRMRRATEKDYGSGKQDDAAHTEAEILELLLKPEWLGWWHRRYIYLYHYYGEGCRCHTEQLLYDAFVQTIWEIIKVLGVAPPTNIWELYSKARPVYDQLYIM